MRKLIYISGLASVNLLLFGVLFKLMHWPGAGILLMIAFSSFILWFLPTALTNNYKSSEKAQSPWMHIIVYIVCAIEFIAALFKIMHWPGAGILMIIGIPAPFVLFLPVYVYQHNKLHKKPDFNFFAIMFLFVYVAVFSALLALSPSKDVVYNSVILGEHNRSTRLVMEQVNQQKLENTQIKELKEKTNELCRKIDQIQDDLLLYSGNQSKNYKETQLTELKNKFARNASQTYFDKNSPALDELKEAVSTYRNFAISNIPEKKTQQRNFVFNILDTSSIVSTHDSSISKDAINLRNTTLIMILNHLSRLQTNVRLVEQEILIAQASA